MIAVDIDFAIEAIENCSAEQKAEFEHCFNHEGTCTSLDELGAATFSIVLSHVQAVEEETAGQNSMEDDINEGDEAARGRA